MRRPILLATIGILPVVAAPLRAEEHGDPLVHTERGTIPIVLTAPHGGKERIPDVQDRESGVTRRDTATYEVVVGLAKGIEERLGERPYVVAALFHRSSADANREADEAYEDEDAEPHYEAYHDALVRVVAEVRTSWPDRGLLLDIHGQASFEGIHRGTQDGRTVRRLVKRIGEEAFVGPEGILGRMAAAGYEVFPPVGRPFGDPEEDSRFNGGFTVQAYSDAEKGIDAIQLELGPKLRTDEKRRRALVKDLAGAIAGFYEDAMGTR